MKKRETGWKPLPLSIKVIFVFLCIGLVSQLNSLFSVYQYGYGFFGVYAHGVMAVLLAVLFPLAAQFFLVLGIWKRESWVSWYGWLFYLVLILFSLLSLINLDSLVAAISEKLVQHGGEALPGGFSVFFFWILFVIVLFSCLIDVVFGIFLFRARKYFLSK